MDSHAPPAPPPGHADPPAAPAAAPPAAAVIPPAAVVAPPAVPAPAPPVASPAAAAAGPVLALGEAAAAPSAAAGPGGTVSVPLRSLAGVTLMVPVAPTATVGDLKVAAMALLARGGEPCSDLRMIIAGAGGKILDACVAVCAVMFLCLVDSRALPCARHPQHVSRWRAQRGPAVVAGLFCQGLHQFCEAWHGPVVRK